MLDLTETLGAEGDAETTQRIAGCALQALLDAPAGDGIAFDRWERPQLVWMRDVKDQFLHGAIDLAMSIRWKK